jgi:hypothetical protein
VCGNLDRYQTENPEQLQQLVAPIALCPDSLVASILAASRYPSEIAEANDFLAPPQNFTPKQIASDADNSHGRPLLSPCWRLRLSFEIWPQTSPGPLNLVMTTSISPPM